MLQHGKILENGRKIFLELALLQKGRLIHKFRNFQVQNGAKVDTEKRDMFYGGTCTNH